jgi:hypothetical protein
MSRLTKILMINLLLFLIIILSIETICFFARQLLDKPSVGWVYRTDSQILAEHPCVLMKTHPILGHIPDHKNKCNIKGGYGVDSYVFYGDKNANIKLPAIITLGGSTSSGFYQHYAEGDTYPFLLSQLVKGEGYQIINGGHGGYSSSQELLKLSTEVRALKYKTPIIISLNGINDLYVPDHPNPFLDDRVQIMLNKQIWIDQGFLPKFLPSTWSLINKFSPNLQDDEKKYKTSLIFQKPQPYEVWEMNIKAMHEISKSMGVKYFTFLQPTMMLEGVQSQLPKDINSKDYEMVKAFKENFIWEEGYELGYVDLLRSNYKKMIEVCKELVFCYDISDIAPPSGNNYDNPRHHNGNGNKLIANQIYEILLKEL